MVTVMAFVASENARAYAADVALALQRAGLSRKEAALTMQIPESLLSEQLACADGRQLSASRLADLPAVFHDELDALRAERRGAVLLRKDLVDLLRGAAQLGRRGMVKAQWALGSSRRRA